MCRLVVGVLAVCVLIPVGCSNDEGSGVDCGPGTVARQGFCIVESDDVGVEDHSDVIGCGEGTVLLDGECRPAGARCGEGTVLQDGRCVLDPRDVGVADVPSSDADSDDGPADAVDVDTTRDVSDADMDADTGWDAAPDGGEDTANDADDTAPDVSCTLVETEWCDGRDNDCDGVIDNGEVCPDNSVANTTPFTDGVFLQGTTSEGACYADALQQFWPTLEIDYYTDFSCYADRYQFRRSDNTVYYYATFSGIKRHESGQNDTLIPTPPCGDYVDELFSFDSQGRLYYQCSDTLRRGNGTLIAYPIKRLVVTLDDGRSVVLKASNTANGDDYVVVDQQGQELARLNPRGQFVGTMTVNPEAASKLGDEAFVLFNRTWGQGSREFVAYRLTAQNQWQRMRRIPVTSFGYDVLVISDGTVFQNERDPNSTFDNQIAAYPPGGLRQIVWREANASTVRQHIGKQMLVGPKNTP